METSMTPSGFIERRHAQRLKEVEEHRIVATRVRPGIRARLIDVSAGGALIETTCRLLPGASVELHVETTTSHLRMRGRVLRCSVSRVRPACMVYRGAIGFDRHLPWFVDEPGSKGSPDARPADPPRALSTHEVI
jgi:PilZ domain-containing protein